MKKVTGHVPGRNVMLCLLKGSRSASELGHLVGDEIRKWIIYHSRVLFLDLIFHSLTVWYDISSCSFPSR